MSNQQQACAYAALILSESGKTDAASIAAVTKAAGVEISAGMAAAFSAALATVDTNAVLGSMSFASAGHSAGGAAAPAAGGAAAPAAAAKQEEPEEEGDDDMGFGLFD